MAIYVDEVRLLFCESRPTQIIRNSCRSSALTIFACDSTTWLGRIRISPSGQQTAGRNHFIKTANLLGDLLTRGDCRLLHNRLKTRRFRKRQVNRFDPGFSYPKWSEVGSIKKRQRNAIISTHAEYHWIVSTNDQVLAVNSVSEHDVDG
jgi:hypothetical protein